MRKLRVACAQLGPIARRDSRETTIARLMDLMREAHASGVELVVFPELALTTFFPRWFMDDPAEIDSFFETEMPNAVTQPLFDLAKSFGIGFYLGYAEKYVDADSAPRYFNTSILVNPEGAIVSKYRKIHLPGHDAVQPDLDSQHLEKLYFEKGNLGFPVVKSQRARLGMCICNDRRWAETYRVLALQNAEMVLVGYNTPIDHTGNYDFDGLTEFHNQLALQAGAYQNSLWVVATAKAGLEEGSQLIGQSMIVAPSGQVVAMASTTGDELVSATCDMDMATLYRKTIFDFSRHREPDDYHLITQTKGWISTDD